MITLTLSEVRRVASEIVSERPTFVYAPNGEACYYIPKPEYSDQRAETGCLVGEMLSRMGAMNDKIAEAKNTIAGILNGEDSDSEYVEYGIRAENEVVTEYLTELQTSQDAGRAWYRALEAAEEIFKDVE